MSKADWFRKRNWRVTDRTDFFTRLGRARPGSRSQYLRIQAVHLEEAGNFEAALELLDLLVADYPDQVQLAAAHHQRARCLEKLERNDAAEEAYRSSLETMRLFPHARTNAHLDFAWFALAQDRGDLFLEAHGALEEFSECMIFPVEVFRYASAKALIFARTGRTIEAKLSARLALYEAARDETDLTYHKATGPRNQCR